MPDLLHYDQACGTNQWKFEIHCEPVCGASQSFWTLHRNQL
jgi:hypothetical protein